MRKNSHHDKHATAYQKEEELQHKIEAAAIDTLSDKQINGKEVNNPADASEKVNRK